MHRLKNFLKVVFIVFRWGRSTSTLNKIKKYEKLNENLASVLSLFLALFSRHARSIALRDDPNNCATKRMQLTYNRGISWLLNSPWFFSLFFCTAAESSESSQTCLLCWSSQACLGCPHAGQRHLVRAKMNIIYMHQTALEYLTM